jgi:hypothetical protein
VNPRRCFVMNDQSLFSVVGGDVRRLAILRVKAVDCIISQRLVTSTPTREWIFYNRRLT